MGGLNSGRKYSRKATLEDSWALQAHKVVPKLGFGASTAQSPSPDPWLARDLSSGPSISGGRGPWRQTRVESVAAFPPKVEPLFPGRVEWLAGGVQAIDPIVRQTREQKLRLA